MSQKVFNASEDFTISPFLSLSAEQIKIKENFDVFINVLRMLLGFWIVISNLVTLIVIQRYSWMKTTPNAFIWSLSLSDLLVGTFMVFWSVSSFPGIKCIPVYWHILSELIACLITVSNLHIIAIAIERFIGVMKPLHYDKYMSKIRSCIFMTFLWIYPVSGLVPSLSLKITQKDNITCSESSVNVITSASNFAGYVILGILLAVLYSRIVKVARDHVTRMNEQQHGDGKVQTEVKAAKVMLIVILAYFTAWTPKYILNILSNIYPIHVFTYHIIYQLFISTGMANSGINFLVYAWKSKEFRKAYKQIFGLRKNQTAPQPVTTDTNA